MKKKLLFVLFVSFSIFIANGQINRLPYDITTDSDGDGKADFYDLDDDNDGILDTEENSTCKISSAHKYTTGTGAHRDEFIIFDWGNKRLDKNNQTITTKKEHGGVTYKAEITYNTSLSDNNSFLNANLISSWSDGGQQMFWRYANYGENVPDDLKGILYTSNFWGTIVVNIKVWAEKDGVRRVIEVMPFDGESTEEREEIIFETNAEEFKLVDNIGGTVTNEVTGLETKKLTYHNTQTTKKSLIASTKGKEVHIKATIRISGGGQGIGIGIRGVDCDDDNDGIPNSLDLDSDNDGCPDAIEGGDAILDKDLKDATISGFAGKNLSSPINEDGVPNIVNAGNKDTDKKMGQSVNKSQDPTKNSCKNYWIGAINNNDWNTTGNWTADEVPVPEQNIEFATTTNNPTGGAAKSDLYVPGDFNSPTIIGNLTNESNKALVVPPGKAITINGSVTGSETAEKSNKIHIKAAAGKPNGSLYAPSVCPKPLFGTVELYAKGKKGALKTWVDDIEGSPTKGHSFTGSYSWQHFGVPVAQVQADPTFYKSYLREYREDTNGDNSKFYQKWITLNNSSILTAFKGYEITQKEPITYMLQGELQVCNKSLTMTRKAPAVNKATGVNKHYGLGQNVFGNSYTAAINVSSIGFPNQAERTVYLYNTGTFVEWTGHSTQENNGEQLIAGQYTAIPEKASLPYNGRIPSMNGFLLRFKSDETVFNRADVTVNLNYQTNGSILSNTKPQTAPKDELDYLEVSLVSKSTIDKLWLVNQEGTTEGFDNGWDGYKFFGTPTAFIYSETPDGHMQVNTTENLENKFISFYPNSDTEYTLYLNKKGLEDYQHLTLVDLETSQLVPLNKEQTIYHFTAQNANVSTKRFKLINTPQTPTNVLNYEEQISLQYFDNKLRTNNNTEENGTMQIFDVAGRLIMNKLMITGFNSYELNLEKGIYFAVVSTKTKKEKLKIVIK